MAAMESPASTASSVAEATSRARPAPPSITTCATLPIISGPRPNSDQAMIEHSAAPVASNGWWRRCENTQRSGERVS